MYSPRSAPAALLAVLLAVALGAGCATTGTASAGPPSAASPAASGPTVYPLLASSELGVGRNRAVFAFLDAATNRPVGNPDRTMEIAFTGPGGETVGPVEGRFIWAIEGERGVYAADVEFPVAGAWTAEFGTAAPGAAAERIRFGFDVKPDTQVLRPGDPAPSVDTPTAEDVGGDLSRLSTDEDPLPAFYETSIAQALAAHEPFVVAFATPKFCATAQCGPTLDRLKPVARAHPDVAFINVEPYQLELVDGQLQPVGGQLQPVPAVSAFGLLSEPYVFVVDPSGTISASFELVFAESEIEDALAGLG